VGSLDTRLPSAGYLLQKPEGAVKKAFMAVKAADKAKAAVALAESQR